jgi:sugar lactone lactonase YvrE
MPCALRIRRLETNTVTRVINTVAGNGQPGFSGDNGPAVQASLNLRGFFQRQDLAVDGAGNLYFTDTGNNRIRRVDAGTGIITTVAGNGNQAFSGDGGPATSASLNEPTGIAIDSTGNIFIADSLNHRVRKVDAITRVITTVVGFGPVGMVQGGFAGDGGLATTARLNVPVGLAFDGAGNLLVADSFNQRIRRVNKQTGIITTVAGTGMPGFAGDGASAAQARFNFPNGLAFDASGNLYIADRDNYRVRVIRGPIP